MDWWYTKTLYHAVSTFSVQFNRNDSSTGWTLLPATTSFDVESALAQPDCTTSATFVPSLNATSYAYDCTPAASPVAAETTIITQTAYKPPPATTGNGSLPVVTKTPKPASISVADATQDPYAQGTPFVFFSQYEIVSKTPTVFGNGSAGCAQATQTFTMAEAFSFEYTGADVNGSLLVGEGVVGDVNPALLGLVGQDTAVAGSWVAEPTVVLLMQEVLVAQAALAAGTEITESFLATPTATTPSFVTLAPTGPDGPPKITATPASPRIESTQKTLIVPTPGGGDDNRPTGASQQTQGGNGGGGGDNAQTQGGNNGGGASGQTQAGNNGGPAPAESTRRSVVAFIAHIAQSDVTLQLPAAPTQTVVTAAFDGQTVTATRLSAVQGTQGGLGGLLGSVGGPASPTNAFDVLSQAEATFPGSNPTANAIINGMGGPAESGGGGGSPQAQEDNLSGGGQNGGQNGGGSGSGQNDGGSDGSGQSGQNGDGSDGSGQSGQNGGGSGGSGQNGGSGDSGSSGGSGSGSTDGGSRAITVGGAVVTPNAQNEFNLGPGATLTPGGTAVADGTTFSLNPAGTAVVVNGVTQQLGSPAQATGGAGGAIGAGAGAGAVGVGAAANIPLITMSGAAITPNAATEYSLAPGATLTPGGAVVVDGTTLSLDASGRQLVVDGVTRDLASPAQATPGAGAITVGGAVVTPNAAGQYTVAPGATLTPGGVVVVDGTTYSLDPAATALVVDGQTRSLASPAQATAGAITVDGAIITPNAAGQYAVAPGATLTPGGPPVVVDGTTYSLAPAATALVVDGQTQPLGSAGTTMAPILTIDGHTFHALNGGTSYVVAGQTLTMGGAAQTVTLDGTAFVVSLAPSATRLVVATEGADGVVAGTSTATLFPEQGAGAGSGVSATATASGRPEQQVGNVAARGAVVSWTGGVAFALSSLVLAIWL